jgi:hypothetical protein
MRAVHTACVVVISLALPPRRIHNGIKRRLDGNGAAPHVKTIGSPGGAFTTTATFQHTSTSPSVLASMGCGALANGRTTSSAFLSASLRSKHAHIPQGIYVLDRDPGHRGGGGENTYRGCTRPGNPQQGRVLSDVADDRHTSGCASRWRLCGPRASSSSRPRPHRTPWPPSGVSQRRSAAGGTA